MNLGLMKFLLKPLNTPLTSAILFSISPFGRREWNGIKGIFLEYYSLLLFGSFNEGNGKSTPLFGSLSSRKWNG